MAKQIKVIKCPQCGSVRQTLIGKDTYKCNDCGTNYFLDNDDINININEEKKEQPVTPPVNVKPKKVGGIIVIAVILFFFFMSKLCGHKEAGKTSGTSSPSQSKIEGSIKLAKLIDDPNSDNPMAFIIDTRRQGTKGEGEFMVLYDLNKGEIAKEKQLYDGKEAFRSVSYYVYDFFNSWYLEESMDKSYTCYKLDPKNLIIENVGDKLAKDFPELSARVATVHKDTYQEAFDIMSNDGDKYSYSPYSNKLYADDDDVKADKTIPLHNSYYYGFTEAKNYTKLPQSKRVQLIELRCISQNKKLKEFDLSWDYDSWGRGYVIDALWFNGKYEFSKDVTPDRKYFGGNRKHDDHFPRVIYWNNNEVIVLIKANANPSSTYNLQSISTKDGSVRWTIETNWQKKLNEIDFKEYKNCYVLAGKGESYDFEFYKIDKNKPALKEYDIPQYPKRR